MEEDQEQNYVTFQEDYVKSHWWARLWMSWAVPFIKHVNKEKQIRDASQCAKMPEGDNSAPTTERMEQVIGDMEKREKEFDYKKNMIWIILKTFKKDMSIVVFWGTLAEITATTNLWFSSFFVRWLQDGGENYEGYLYAIGFVLLFYISQLFRVNYFFSSNYLGINMRKAISCIMYKKALKLSQKSKAISSTGKMITIVSSELQTIEWGIQMAPYLVIAPISTIASFAYIAIDFKEAAAIGFAIFILIIIAQVILSKISLSWKYKESKFSDKRMDVISDGVNGIRTIKTYGWENPFQTLINNFRNKQLKFVGLSHLISSLGFGVFQNGGFLIAIGIFGYHWAMNRELDYSRSLTAITILSYMSQFSIYFLFTAFNCMASLLAILRRTGEVMGMEEYDSEGSKDDHTLQHPIRISIEDASFSWGFKIKKDTSEKSEVDQDSKDINLKSINFTAEEGQLTAIVGAVGWGKSTMLAAMMHELETTSGIVRTNGTKAYVEQEPFIISGSFIDNIILGSDFDRKLFDKTIELWWLDSDLEQMPNGAETTIGERGINVSGGQKARISLARAIYSQADILLLDDPLSAVDPDVASKLFSNCIAGYLKDKWVILVTHQIQFLKNVEKILVIEDNQIKIEGNYQELKQQGMDFDKILKTYEKEEEDKSDEIIFDEEEEENPSISESVHKKSSRMKSNQVVETSQDLVLKNNQKKNLIEKEKMDTGKLRLKDWWNFYKYGTGVTGLLLTFFFTIISSVFFLSVSYVIGLWARKDFDEQQESYYFNLFYTAVLAYFVLIYIRAIVISFSCWISSKNLHSLMVYKVFRAPIQFFDTTPIGRIVTRLAQDIGWFDTLLPLTMNFVFNNVFRALVIVVLMWVAVPFMIIPAIIVLIIAMWVRNIVILPQNDCKRFDSITKAPINTKFGSVLDGMTSIRAYGKEAYFSDQFMNDVDINANVLFTYQGVVRWCQSRLDLTSLFIMSVNGILLVILNNHTNFLSVVLASLSFQLSNEYGIVMAYLIRMTGELENYMTKCQRVVEYAEMDTEDQLVKDTDPQQWPETPDIYFDNVVMRYREGLEPVLKGLQTKISAGQKVGIIGRTGAGKSSIIQAIFRLVEIEPDSSIIISGDNIKDLGLHCLRLNISFIPQTPFLMTSSIRDNLDPFHDYSDDIIWQSLAEVQLKSYIEELDQKLDTHVADNNVVFSVGQKQLICLARAILRRNKILVLDEATANVDIETDSMIQQTIREKFKDCTVLTIAHRMATIADSDKILVIKDGKIEEEGPPSKILNHISRKHSH